MSHFQVSKELCREWEKEITAKCANLEWWIWSRDAYLEKRAELAFHKEPGAAQKRLSEAEWGWNGQKNLGTRRCWYCPVWNRSRTWISEIGALSGDSMGRSGLSWKDKLLWRNRYEKQNLRKSQQQIAKTFWNYEEVAVQKLMEFDNWKLMNSPWGIFFNCTLPFDLDLQTCRMRWIFWMM